MVDSLRFQVDPMIPVKEEVRELKADCYQAMPL